MVRLGHRIRFHASAMLLAGCLMAPPGHAAVVAYTDRSAFLAAIGGAATVDDFESQAPGAIGHGETRGDFRYTFDASVAPTVVPGGFGGQALGGPFDVFVGGDSVRLSYGGGTGLRAFGLQVLYAPAFDTVAADVYRLRVADGASAGAFIGNTPLDSAGGAFFLGLVADAGSEFAQIDLLSVVPLDANGDPLLVPAYQADDLSYLAADARPVAEPATAWLLLAAAAGLRATRRRSG